MKYKNDLEYGKNAFYCKYSKPSAYRNSSMPCRALITPRDPRTGKLVTKRQLYGTDSDEPVNYCVRGKSPAQIEREIFPKAAQLMIGEMQEMGIISTKKSEQEKHDLAHLGASFENTFFDLHTVKDNWGDSTIKTYRGQYKTLLQELEGIAAEELDEEGYRTLQLKIFANALEDSNEDRQTFCYGDSPSSSGKTRVHLLYLLLQDLKQIEGYAIPVTPVRYKGKISRTQELLIYIDKARYYPPEDIEKLILDARVTRQGNIVVDCGLRISEDCGLLWASLYALQGSQGRLYYLAVVGQMTAEGIRTEIGKTDAAYRTIPISRELGDELFQQKEKLEGQYGDISLKLLCGRPEEQDLNDSPKVARRYQSNLASAVTAVLRTDAVIQHQKELRVFEFDVERQDKEMISELTCHSLRRFFDTWMHCASGLEESEIDRQMGHAAALERNESRCRGLTREALYKMCLKRYVSGTWIYPAHPLCYSAAGQYKATEVPACALELVISPGEEIELVLEDTEPGNQILLHHSVLNVELVQTEEKNESEMTYALLASKEKYEICAVRKPFAVDEEGDDEDE